MFTDGASFTGTSRLRILGASDVTTKLPKLAHATLPEAPPVPEEEPFFSSDPLANAQNHMSPEGQRAGESEEHAEERKRVRRTSDEQLVEQVGATNHEQPGEGIHASASTLAAPKSWGMVKESMMKQVAKTRRASYVELMKEAEKALAPNVAIGDERGLRIPPMRILQMLSGIAWFRKLTNTELKKLVSRSETSFFPKGHTILRENSFGSAFYVLLEGRVCCRSDARHIDIALNPGTCFGEAALATSVHVRREATVTALEDSWCLKMTARDMEDLVNVELETLRKIYYAKLLMRVRWFDMLTQSKLEALGRMMELETYSAARVVFNEGETGDKMYILVSGAVGIFKYKGGSPVPVRPAAADPPSTQPSPARRASLVPPPPNGKSAGDDDAAAGSPGARPPPPPESADLLRDSWASQNMLLAECNQQSKNPWFGETALFNDGRPRGATAFTLEQTQLLSVHCSQAKKLQEIIPEFFRMNLAYSTVYKKVNQLNGTEQSNLDNMSSAPKLKAQAIVSETGKAVTDVVSVQ